MSTMQSMSETKRPLSELVAWAASLLELNEGREKNRKQFIKIASEASPNKTFSLVENMAINYGFAREEANGIARAARWLAMIRLDYGQTEFYRIVAGKR